MIIEKLQFYTHEDGHFVESELDPIEFHENKINVILSDTTKESGNGVGKTQVLEIIDYCLGSMGGSDSFINLKESPLFSNIVFSLTIKLHGISYKIYRSFQEQYRSYIYIEENDFTNFLSLIEYDEKFKLYKLKLNDWKQILNHLCFYKNTKQGFRELLYFYIKHTKAEYNKTTHEYILSSASQNKKNVLSQLLYLLTNSPDARDPLDLYKESFKIKTILEENHKISQLGYFESSKWLKKITEAEYKDNIKLGKLGKSLEILDRELETLSNSSSNDLKKEINVLSKEIASLYFDLNNKQLEFNTLNDIISKINAESKISHNEITDIYETINLIFSDVAVTSLDSVYQFHKKIHDERLIQYGNSINEVKTSIKILNKELKEKGLLRENLYKELYQTDMMETLRLIDNKKNVILVEFFQLETKIKELKHFKTRIEELNKQDVDFNKLDDEFSLLITNFHQQFDSIIRSFYDQDTISYPFIQYNISENQFNLIANSGAGKNEMAFVLFDWIRNIMCASTTNFKVQIHDSTLLSDIDHPALIKYFSFVQEIVQEKEFQYIVSLSNDELKCLKDIDHEIVITLSKEHKLLRQNF